MATCRTQVGLRRRGPGLSAPTSPRSGAHAPRASRPTRRAGWGLALGLAALLPGCFGLDEAEQKRLELHQQSSQRFYREGRLQQALQQADKALELDDDHVGMRLVRGYCLVRLGKRLDSTAEIDKAVEIFDRLAKGAGGENPRTWLGRGQAHFARALMHIAEAASIERRLASDFLDADGRELESGWLATEQRGRDGHLRDAERSLRHVLGMENEAENVWAMMELVLVLNTAGGHDDEAVQLSHRAIRQLEQQNELARNNLRKNASLTAAHSLELERRIEENLARERQLRDLIATIEFHRGAFQAALEQLEILEERQLITAANYRNRADIRERLGLFAAAADDLESYLRTRSSQTDYDDIARETFARIDELRRRAEAEG